MSIKIGKVYGKTLESGKKIYIVFSKRIYKDYYNYFYIDESDKIYDVDLNEKLFLESWHEVNELYE